MTRFRADYRRQITEEEGGDTVHTLVYPEGAPLMAFPFGAFTLQSTLPVGTVREHPDGSASAYTPDGELIDLYRNAEAAIDVLIKDDQGRHNRQEG